jgi:hypothetical protein
VDVLAYRRLAQQRRVAGDFHQTLHRVDHLQLKDQAVGLDEIRRPSLLDSQSG